MNINFFNYSEAIYIFVYLKEYLKELQFQSILLQLQSRSILFYTFPLSSI